MVLLYFTLLYFLGIYYFQFHFDGVSWPSEVLCFYLPPGVLLLHIFGKLLVLMNFYTLQYFWVLCTWPTFE